MTIFTSLQKTALLTIALMLSGCVSLLPQAGDLPPRLGLDAGPPPMAETAPRIKAPLVIADPDSAAVYNSFHVAVVTAPLQYEYLAKAEWTDRVPLLVRRFVEQRFENERLFEAVGDRTEIPVGGYELQTDIRAFHLDRSSGDEVARVAIGFRLVGQQGDTLGSYTFSADMRPQGRSPADRARALNQAITLVVDAAMAWVEGLVQASEAEAGSSA